MRDLLPSGSLGYLLIVLWASGLPIIGQVVLNKHQVTVLLLSLTKFQSRYISF